MKMLEVQPKSSREFAKQFGRSASLSSATQGCGGNGLRPVHLQAVDCSSASAMNGAAGKIICVEPSSEFSKPEDLELLAKLEEANRQLELDNRARSTLTPPKTRGHSRHPSLVSISSETSQCSISSSCTDVDTSSPEELWQMWSKLVTDWDNVSKKKEKLIKALVHRGIPQYFRGLAWALLAGANDPVIKSQYVEYLKQTSATEKAIRRDITRTYPDHSFFKQKNGLGQESLFNVMKAYSLHDREVGYCQGSCFIVGLLLMQMPEEEAFSVLVKLMLDYRMRELFKPSMAELGLCMHQLDYLIQEHLSQLNVHFQSQNLNVTMFASSWFLTIFATALPLNVTCRVFDIFLLEGFEFLFQVALAILQLFQDELFARDMEGMIKFLQKDCLSAKLENDPDLLISAVMNIKINFKKLKKLEKEYTAMKTKEHEDQVELRRLRTENRLLRQRIDNLEKETGTLADRLVHDQMRCAQQMEQIAGLRKNLSSQRMTNREVERSNSGSSSGSTGSAYNTDMEQLKTEVIKLKHKDSESQAAMKQMRERIIQLEQVNQQMSMPREPNAELQSMEEQLIACKLREAEASLAIKELQHSILELEKRWTIHLQKYGSSNGATGGKAAKAAETKQLAEEVMGLRLKEARSMAELKDIKQLYMEMETKNHIHERHIKRLEEENAKLREEIELRGNQEKQLQSNIDSLERQLSDLNTKIQEGHMMMKLKDAENSQTTAEMRQRIAELEIENQELRVTSQLQAQGSVDDLEDEIANLQDEVQQLRLSGNFNHLASTMRRSSFDSQSETDSEDLEATVLASRLQFSDGVGLRRSPDTTYSSTDTLLNPSSPVGSPGTLSNHSPISKSRPTSTGDSDRNRTPTNISDLLLVPISIDDQDCHLGTDSETIDAVKNEVTHM